MTGINLTSTLSPMNSTNSTTPMVMLRETWVRAVLITLYAFVFILGLSGNILVVFVVVRNRTMQTITNIFISNLAVSDIMMCLLAVPFTPISALLHGWVFGRALCHLIPMALGVSVYVSTLTSTAIAIDRYFVIVHPFKPRMRTSVCLLLIVAIWIISISISLPLAIYQTLNWDKKIDAPSCFESWPKPNARQFFTVTSLVLQYIVPCSVITYCYVNVSTVLRVRAQARSQNRRCRDRDEIEIKRKRRTNRMLIAMVCIFVVCWLPLNIVLIFTEYKGSLDNWEYYEHLFLSAHVIAMSSTIYNPFLYAWMNENFKKEFKQVVPGLFYIFGQSSRAGNAATASQYTTVETTVVAARNGNLKPNENDAAFDSQTETVALNVRQKEDED